MTVFAEVRLCHFNTCFWYPNTNNFFRIPKASHFSKWPFLGSYALTFGCIFIPTLFLNCLFQHWALFCLRFIGRYLLEKAVAIQSATMSATMATTTTTQRVMIPSSPDDHPPPDYPRHCYYCC
jgi:hypothetical protein